MRPMGFDPREVRRSLILAGIGTGIVVGLFAAFLAAHPSSYLAANAPAVVRAGPAQVAGAR